MKTWKTVAISVITTASLVTAGATAYNFLQPSHYEGDTFTNVSTSISNTSTSTSVSSSTESIEDTNSSTNTNSVYTEYSNTEQVTQYNTLWVYASTSKGYCDREGNHLNRSGFYILTPVQNHTNYVEVIEIDMRTNDEYHVKVYGETDEISDINYQSACDNAEQFCNWIREQAPDGYTTQGLQSNYDYWVKNCKYK